MDFFMTNVYRMLTALTLAAGENTAYTAPSGTAIMLGSLVLSTNISATAANVTAQIRIGPTGSPFFYQNITAIPASGRYETNSKVALASASWAILISASTGSALDCLIAGLRMTP